MPDEDTMTAIKSWLNALLGANDEAWIDAPDEPLTPREHRLRQAVRVLRWAALLHGLLALLLITLTVVSWDAGLRLGGLLLSGGGLSAGAALLAVILLLLVSMVSLLLLAIGAAARERWAVAGAWVLVGVNLLLAVTVSYWAGLLSAAISAAGALMVTRDWRGLGTNPVLLRELRGRMRGVRAFAIISIYLALMSGFTILLYMLQMPDAYHSGPVVTGQIGRSLFGGVVAAELVLIVFIVPALTASAISGDRERKTYDLLQTTLLPSSAFVAGKMESALSYIVLLLLAAIPLQSMAFLFGGVSAAEIGLAFVILVVTAIALAALGMAMSARHTRTTAAMVRVYGVALLVLLIVPLVALVVFEEAYARAVGGLAVGGNLGPFQEAALIYGDMIATSLNPIMTAFYSQQILVDQQRLLLVDVTLASSGAALPVASPWVLMVITYLTAAALLVLMTVRRLRRTQA